MAAPVYIGGNVQLQNRVVPEQGASGERVMQLQLQTAGRLGAIGMQEAEQVGGIARQEAAQMTGIARQEAVGIEQAARTEARAASELVQQSSQNDVKFAQGMAGIATSFADQMAHAVRTTAMAETKTKFLDGMEALKTQFDADPDWQNAQKTYREGVEKLKSDTYAGFGMQDRAELELSLRRTEHSYNSDVQSRVTRKTADAATAALNKESAAYLNQAWKAKTTTEREGVFADFDRAVDNNIRAGSITAEDGQSRKQTFRKQTDMADVIHGVSVRPRETLSALENPEMFKSLTPVERENYSNQARAAAEAQFVQEATTAAKFDPAKGAAMGGRVHDRSIAEKIVDGALIAQESSGNPNAQSPKGAAGLTQFMPGTARMVAKQMGLDVFEGESDAGVRSILKANPTLARQMAVKHVGDLIDRYEGRLGPAFAAYHAGAGAADRWHTAALEKFGPSYTPQQFISVIPASVTDGAKPTRAYVSDLFSRLGADPNRASAPGTQYKVASAVEGVMSAEKTERKRDLQTLINGTADDRNTILSMFKDGYAPDPSQVLSVKAPLQAAAAGGDANAALTLRKFEAVEQMAPMVRQAFQMPPEQLDAAVSELRQGVAQRGSAADMRRLEVFEGVQKKVAELRTSDPIQLMERQGMAVTAVTPPADATEPGFARAVAQRALVADRAQTTYGGETVFLKPEEAKAMAASFAAAPVDQKAQLLTKGREAIEAISAPNGGKLYDAFVRQVAGNDKVAAIAGRLGLRDANLTRDILNGQALLNADGVKIKSAEVTQALQASFPVGLYPAEVAPQLIEAALAVYANDRAGSGKLFDASDRRGLEAAMERVIGKTVTFNGGKTVVASVSEQGRMTEAWSVLDGDMLKTLGINTTHVEVAKQLGELRPAGLRDGRYYLYVPGAGGMTPAPGTDGKPAVLTIDALWAAAQPQLARFAKVRDGYGRAGEMVPGGTSPRPEDVLLGEALRDRGAP